jgi:hypothetical protein
MRWESHPGTTEQLRVRAKSSVRSHDERIVVGITYCSSKSGPCRQGLVSELLG